MSNASDAARTLALFDDPRCWEVFDAIGNELPFSERVHVRKLFASLCAELEELRLNLRAVDAYLEKGKP